MSQKFNKNHLTSLINKKNNIEIKINHENKRPLPNEVILHEMKAERLYLKEEIKEYMSKH